MSDQVTLESIRTFAKLLTTFLGHDSETRAGIVSMAAIAEDIDATEDEVEGALNTMMEGLFPSDAVDLENSRETAESDREVAVRMDAEEAEFAVALAQRMHEKSLTQAELADLVGIGQPAISMMLSRKCRPQHRTIQKLANALGITAQELWPSCETPKPGTSRAASTPTEFAARFLPDNTTIEFTMPASVSGLQIPFDQSPSTSQNSGSNPQIAA